MLYKCLQVWQLYINYYIKLERKSELGPLRNGIYLFMLIILFHYVRLTVSKIDKEQSEPPFNLMDKPLHCQNVGNRIYTTYVICIFYIHSTYCIFLNVHWYPAVSLLTARVHEPPVGKVLDIAQQ